MPAYKENNGTWTCKFKYKDWLGEWQQKTKRGFSKKKDALDYESEFKGRFTRSANIPLSSLVENYMDDLVSNKKIAITTAAKKRDKFDRFITPYFKNRPINTIEELDVLNWQTWIKQKGLEKYPEKGGYAPTHLRNINNELSAIMNYAIKYYRLQANPCHRAGYMGKSDAEAMQIWTLDEYQLFISYSNKLRATVAFDILYWTGIREGELLALTPGDFLPTLELNINKSFVVVEGEHIIKDPKNETSERCIAIPQFLYDEVMNYIHGLYGLISTDRIFDFTKSFLLDEIKRISAIAGLNPIRIHDLRHSHASLLIEMGFNILMISERLGHKRVQTTWNTYAHLYPDKGRQIAYGLQEARLTGITTNQTAEDHMLGLLGEIQKMLPNYNTYESDEIILWNRDEKQKSVVSREQFDNMVCSDKMEASEAYVIMMKDGYFEMSPSLVFCFSSRGLPVQYL